MSGITGMGPAFGCQTDALFPVGSRPDGASPFGALDMAGNVSEWVADWYDDAYYTDSAGTDPAGPSDGTERVHRGGNYQDLSPNNLRSWRRSKRTPTSYTETIGFRCVK